ncbi:hypothetical protein ACQKP8_02100 [Photobacterium alginatilyticum]|uniref:hypothetical protein n=1 Tax=Photobacterium alginatilyticum TaxID=1775171 RepID=UPI0040694693
MVLEGKKTSFALTVIASSLLIGCNGSGSDSKLDSKPGNSAASSAISGVALDGYLKNAKVCLDLNHNLMCDESDGEVVWSDSQGAYSLARTDADLTQYNILVEAIANKTVDMDFPQSPVQEGFALSAPATLPAVVSPLTTLTAVVANQQGIDFKAARDMLAISLGIDSQRLTSDFLAGTHAQDKQLHAFAQGLTSLMQEAEKAAASDGVAQNDARSGSRVKLTLIDLPALKTETDKLVGTVNNTPVHVQETVKDFISDVTVSRDEAAGNTVQVQPQAPKQGQLNVAARTFDWHWVGMLTSVAQYEYSTDAGKTWQQVAVKPIHLGRSAYAAGDIQVRVTANLAKNMKAGKVVKNTQPLTESQLPAAPASITVNDATNQFNWDLVVGYDDASRYEYSVDGGKTWQAAAQKPVTVGDVTIAAGDVKVRVAADDSGAEPKPAGREVASTTPFTTTPAQPAKPTITSVSDETDSVDWDYVTGFTQFGLYEASLDNGKTWNAVTAKPLSVGNIDIDSGWVQLRVAANVNNGMPAGEAAQVTQVFTAQAGKPAAPTNLRIDDTANTIGWDLVAGYDDASAYEISLKGNSASAGDWNPTGTKPASVGDLNIAKGDVCLRVKADVKDSNVAGIAACSDAYFTAKPDAPTAPVIDDTNNMFGWTLVADYPQLTSYEIKIESADWKAVGLNNNPYQLADKAYEVGSIQVRVAQDAVTGRVASDALVNDQAYTQSAPASDYTLLTAAGAVTQNRAEAACARAKDGKVWQLFDSTNSDARLKTVPEINTTLGAFGTVCGLDTWRNPTMAELNGLFTENPENAKQKIYDTSVFSYMAVIVDNTDWSNPQKACYVSSEASASSPGYQDCLDVSKIAEPSNDIVKPECGGFCFGNLPRTLYRFVAQ